MSVLDSQIKAAKEKAKASRERTPVIRSMDCYNAGFDAGQAHGLRLANASVFELQRALEEITEFEDYEPAGPAVRTARAALKRMEEAG